VAQLARLAHADFLLHNTLSLYTLSLRLAHADFLLHNTLSLYTLSLHAFSVHAFSKHALSLYTLHGGIDRHIFSLVSERCTQKDAAAAGWRVAGGFCCSVVEG